MVKIPDRAKVEIISSKTSLYILFIRSKAKYHVMVVVKSCTCLFHLWPCTEWWGGFCTGLNHCAIQQVTMIQSMTKTYHLYQAQSVRVLTAKEHRHIYSNCLQAANLNVLVHLYTLSTQTNVHTLQAYFRQRNLNIKNFKTGIHWGTTIFCTL